MKTDKTITKEQWDKTLHKTILNGQPYILENHRYMGNCLVPVKIEEDN